MSDTENQPPSRKQPRATKSGKEVPSGPARRGRKAQQAKEGEEKRPAGREERRLPNSRIPGPYEQAASKGGRVSDISPGLILEFVSLRVECALSVDETCVLLGITPAVKTKWLNQGRADVEAGEHHTLHAQFVTLAPRARVQLKAKLQNLMLRKATGEADEEEGGSYSQVAHLVAILFPERHVETGKFLAEQYAAMLQVAKQALPPEQYERLVTAMAEGD